ncbi:XPB/Ssl2-like helicase family protein [Knoellia remsis]|uniref:XPB/Ssl2-like helicase family protein n=2 Tax=Knoellia remsis TaxID=407159 RepID=A0A2T0U6E8_9MICO|nr:XPB/Ssl2-like helicase family protein [Knoellia remsis]
MRAVDGLDTAHLLVLDAATRDSRPAGADAAAVDAAREDLWRLGLAWRGPDGLVVTRTAAEVVTDRRERVAAGIIGDGFRRPELTGPTPPPDRVDAAAGAAASEVLALVDEVVDGWSQSPPRVLRAGGLAVRDLSDTAARLDVPSSQAAFLVELALAAGLVADDGELEPHWVPTADYDAWQGAPGGERWARLAVAWLGSTRAAHRVGGRTDTGAPVNALEPDVTWAPIRFLRRAVLGVVDEASGAAPALDDVAAVLRWARPLRVPDDLETVVGAVLREAAWLGVLGLGTLGAGGRTLLAGADPQHIAELVHPHLPAPVDAVLLQADLTAVAPGPVTGSLAAFLRLVGDIESRGGASVFRFGEASIRRALDAGWTADDILDGLRDASRTPVPQPLDYLVRDAARRHASVRVSAATTVIRSEDEGTLSAMLVDPRLDALRLRRLAPTVVTSPLAPGRVLDRLRAAGFASVAESVTGEVSASSPGARRTSRRPVTDPVVVRRPDGSQLASLVERLREQERNRASTHGDDGAMPESDPETSLALLRDAAADHRGVWVGHTDASGVRKRLLFYPQRVDAGRVTGLVDGMTRTLSVHRITGVAPD